MESLVVDNNVLNFDVTMNGEVLNPNVFLNSNVVELTMNDEINLIDEILDYNKKCYNSNVTNDDNEINNDNVTNNDNDKKFTPLDINKKKNELLKKLKIDVVNKMLKLEIAPEKIFDKLYKYTTCGPFIQICAFGSIPKIDTEDEETLLFLFPKLYAMRYANEEEYYKLTKSL